MTFGYDSNVHLTTITDALGRITTLTYNPEGLVTQATDPFGRSALFEYDANKNLTKITDMGGYWTRLSYDADVYLTSLENIKGEWGFYIEPSDGVMGSTKYPRPGDSMWQTYRITVTNPLGKKEEYHYTGEDDPWGEEDGWYVSPRDYIDYVDVHTNNASSNVPKTGYAFTVIPSGQRGEINRISYPEGGYVEYRYDSLTGNRTSVKHGHGMVNGYNQEHTVYYTYNNMGRITSFKDAKNNTTTLNYASNGIDLLEIKNGLGTITRTYNGTHEVTSITDLLGNKTTFTYNSFGQLESLTEADGDLNIVSNFIYYDVSHNSKYLLKELKKDGQTIGTFTYDTIGRVNNSTDATGLTLTYGYNNLNNITSISYPDSKFISYSYSGCCPHLVDSVTDRTGRTTQYTYDALKRLTETVTPGGEIIKNVYDPNGNIIKLIDANGNVTTFEYDKDNRLTKKIYADGKSELLTYDIAGLLISRTNARGIITNYSYLDAYDSYNKNDNLRTISYSDGTPGVSYQYDDYNRVTQRQDGIGLYQYSYDANSQIVTINGPLANDTLTYQYDTLGRRISLAPQGGQALSYGYDSLNRLSGIQAGTNNYSYSYINANPLVQSLTRPNGSITTYQYDNLNRLTEISNKNSSSEILNKYAYAYNQQDMRSGETITNGDPITSFQKELIAYNHNNVNQLLSSVNPAKAFTYDNDGNMTQGYTPEGYVFTASYDAEDRLTSVQYTDSGGVVHKTEYLYSGNSFLAEMKKYENSALINATRFVRDRFLPLQECDANNNVVSENVWGLNLGGGVGGLLNLKQNGQDYSYLYDGKGNVTALIDSAQSVAATYTYDTFGNLISKTGALNQPFQFSTKPYDAKTGLSYYGYRFYSPAIGRWINRDPLGEEGGMNLYGFVGDNPVNNIDPFGEDWNEVADSIADQIEKKLFIDELNDSFAKEREKECRLPSGGGIGIAFKIIWYAAKLKWNYVEPPKPPPQPPVDFSCYQQKSGCMSQRY